MATGSVQSMTTVTTLDAAFNVSGLSPNAKIFAYKYLNLLFVVGYLNKATSGDIAFGSVIATVSGVSLVWETFDSPNSDSGDTARLILKTNGQIKAESAMKADQWYSFSFTAVLNS